MKKCPRKHGFVTRELVPNSGPAACHPHLSNSDGGWVREKVALFRNQAVWEDGGLTCQRPSNPGPGEPEGFKGECSGRGRGAVCRRSRCPGGSRMRP